MKFFKEKIKFKTKKQFEIKDLTSKAEEMVSISGVKNGILTVFSLHTSATLAVNEKEPCFFNDFEEFVKKFVPREKYYRHNDLKIRTENLVCSPGVEECLNGDSHIQHMFIGYPSVTLII